MTEFWKMIAWLLREQFGWFLVCCAFAAVWFSAMAVLLEYAWSEIAARLIVRHHKRVFREDWRHE